MDLGRNLGFEILDKRMVPYRLTFRDMHSTPALDILVRRGNPITGAPFAPRDLEPNRVGFIRHHDGEIDCVPMTWVQHVWTNIDVVRNSLPAAERLHVLAASVLLETKDGQFPLSLRSKNVTLYPGYWHVSAAGYVDFEKARYSGSLLHTVFAEMNEEINVLPMDIEYVKQLGVCLQTRPDTAVVEALFCARAKQTGEHMVALSKGARDAFEGTVHLFPKDVILQMCKTEKFVPSAIATIMLALQD